MRKGSRGGGLIPVDKICSRFSGLNVGLSRVMILESVWEKEIGVMAKHWELYAVKGGAVLVKTKASSAAQELKVRSAGLIKNLNKYFDSKWIKKIQNV